MGRCTPHRPMSAEEPATVQASASPTMALTLAGITRPDVVLPSQPACRRVSRHCRAAHLEAAGLGRRTAKTAFSAPPMKEPS